MTRIIPTIDDLVAAAGPGVAVILDAADRLCRLLEDAEFRASFAPVPTHYAQCPCGSVMEIHGDLDTDDYAAIRDWESDHQECEAEI
ncbi:hypothetical protein [Mycobacterium canetti]|uniref:hypothetical protein n=1 Tax=Mycobacterium canetti TaxID=78331 RepID=UPI00034A969D|nr:hypothetical protein [Mycobacterium canetti]